MSRIASKNPAVLSARLTERLQDQKIRFSMACNTLVIRSADKKVVQLNDQSYSQIEIAPIRLERGNTMDVSGRTRFYDRSSTEVDQHGLTDNDVIEAVFDWMRTHPNSVEHVRVQLRVHGEYDPVQPFPGYDNMDPESIRIVLSNTEYDLMGLLMYETTVRPTQTDPKTGEQLQPREDVIDVLEEVQQAKELQEIVDADEGVGNL